MKSGLNLFLTSKPYPPTSPLQGIEWLARLLQIVPLFGLYRVLYEVSQYSFLAKKNNSQGMQWSNLSE